MNIKKINQLLSIIKCWVSQNWALVWITTTNNHHALPSRSYPTLKYNYLLLQSEPTHLEELPLVSEDVHGLLT